MKAHHFIIVCILILRSSKEVKPLKTSKPKVMGQSSILPMVVTFLLKECILIIRLQNSFQLLNYRLDFQTYDLKYWNGAFATIVKDSDSDVWGALWTLDHKDIPHLDEQEGIHRGVYKVRNVSVHTPDGKTFLARTYQMIVDPPKVPVKDIPSGRQPSDTYMKVILYGAIECALPIHYIRFLFTIPSNGKLASLNALEKLGHPFNVTEAT